MCSASEAGSYSRLMNFVYHSTLGLRAIKNKTRQDRRYLLGFIKIESVLLHVGP